MKPILLGAYIPPVTGVGGIPGSVVANSFDVSGNFRPRVNSKRMRSDDYPHDNRFDLTKDFPPLSFPGKQHLDVASVSSLLVAASEAMPGIREIGEKSDNAEVKKLAHFSCDLFKLLETIVERVVKPMADAAPLTRGDAPAGGGSGPATFPKPDHEKRLLRETLLAAEKTSILHDANLGNMQIANKVKLNHAFSAGIREGTLKKAEEDGLDPAEAVRVTDDALSLVKDITFLGQVSKPINNKYRPGLSHMTMPIKLVFEDRGSRIHFERTLGARCGLRATMSLPRNIRIAQAKFGEAIKDKYADRITMVRTDTEKMRFIAFHKEEGGQRWIPCPEWQEIPPNILSESYAPRGGEQPLAAGDPGGSEMADS
jgi:hypothetical protein